VSGAYQLVENPEGKTCHILVQYDASARTAREMNENNQSCLNFNGPMSMSNGQSSTSYHIRYRDIGKRSTSYSIVFYVGFP
jgi:hypothetical protein